MPEPALNMPFVSAMVLGAGLSLCAGMFLFQRHIDGRPLLAYEPRRHVPWGPLVVVIPVFFISLNFISLLVRVDAAKSPDPDPQEFFYGGLVTSLLMIGFVFAAMTWLLAEGRATRGDLGLPANGRQLWRDVLAGCIACVAALLPIYAINLVLVVSLQVEEQHPLVEELSQNHSPQLMVLGLVSAVIAAPLFEEFAFRVLLQGWLERLEDERQMYSLVGHPLEIPPADLETDVLPTQPPREPPPLATRPTQGWIAALPHGWTPIILSAIAFGLAHVGHGAAPVPLTFLGLVLGYLYQRTHRLAPCVAAHALFNAYSLLLLWLQLGQT